MRFGACIPHYGVPASKKAISDFCKLAEQLMFDSVWTTDHLAVSRKYADPYGNIFESLVTLTFAAAATQHIKLGTSIIVLPMRDPILFAKQVASADALSDGRMILGLGAGWMEDEFATFKSNYSERGKIMDEQIRLLRVLWTEDEPRFDGRFFRVTDAVTLPKPVQKNGPPIWIGGSSSAALRRVARLGDGWHPVGLSPDEIVAGKRTLESFTKGDRDIVITARLPVEISESAPTTYAQSSGEQAYMLGGSRQQIVKELEAFREAGLDHLVCFFGNKPYEFVDSQARQFAKDIIPSFSR